MDFTNTSPRNYGGRRTAPGARHDSIDRGYALPARTSAASVLTLQDVTKSYGGARSRAVLRDVSLTVDDGELVAIMGESGAGKSTLLNLIAGLDLPDSGSVVLDGTDLARLDDDARTLLRRRRMGFVFQAFHLLPHLTIFQNVRLPLDLAETPRDEANARAAAMLEAVGIA